MRVECWSRAMFASPKGLVVIGGLQDEAVSWNLALSRHPLPRELSEVLPEPWGHLVVLKLFCPSVDIASDFCLSGVWTFLFLILKYLLCTISSQICHVWLEHYFLLGMIIAFLLWVLCIWNLREQNDRNQVLINKRELNIRICDFHVNTHFLN